MSAAETTLTRGQRFYAAIEAEREDVRLRELEATDAAEMAWWREFRALDPAPTPSLASPERDDDEPICTRCGHRSIRPLCDDCNDNLNGINL